MFGNIVSRAKKVVPAMVAIAILSWMAYALKTLAARQSDGHKQAEEKAYEGYARQFGPETWHYLQRDQVLELGADIEPIRFITCEAGMDKGVPTALILLKRGRLKDEQAESEEHFYSIPLSKWYRGMPYGDCDLQVMGIAGTLHVITFRSQTNGSPQPSEIACTLTLRK